MANFESVVQWLLYQEDSHMHPGAIVNLGDGAGLTRLGITQKSYGTQVPVDFFTTMNFHDAVLTAKTVYQKFYWNIFNGDQINADEIAAVIISFAVNKSIPTAVRTIQNALGLEPADGILGSHTLSEINSKDPGMLARLYRADWINYYQQIAAINPKDQKFLQGWINRVNFPYPSSLVGNTYA